MPAFDHAWDYVGILCKCALGVWGFRLRIYDLCLGSQGLGLRCQVWELGFRIQGSGLAVCEISSWSLLVGSVNYGSVEELVCVDNDPGGKLWVLLTTACTSPPEVPLLLIVGDA